ncbi:hypothetical protein VPH35_133985 [Triticum aestivum]
MITTCLSCSLASSLCQGLQRCFSLVRPGVHRLLYSLVVSTSDPEALSLLFYYLFRILSISASRSNSNPSILLYSGHSTLKNPGKESGKFNCVLVHLHTS